MNIYKEDFDGSVSYPLNTTVGGKPLNQPIYVDLYLNGKYVDRVQVNPMTEVPDVYDLKPFQHRKVFLFHKDTNQYIDVEVYNDGNPNSIWASNIGHHINHVPWYQLRPMYTGWFYAPELNLKGVS